MTNLTNLINTAINSNVMTETDVEIAALMAEQNAGLDDYMNTLKEKEAMENQTMQDAQDLQHYIDNINASAFVSTMASDMFHQELTPANALIVSASFVEALQYHDDAEMFAMCLIDGINNTTVAVTNVQRQVEVTDLTMDSVSTALTNACYLDADGNLGTKAVDILTQNTHAYTPLPASDGIKERVFPYAATKDSPLFREFIHALEANEFVVDELMFEYAKAVDAKMLLNGTEEKDLVDTYVLRGCQTMLSRAINGEQIPHVSEFKGDTRGRGYQASCHGPNGQSSDRSRALMDLANVPMDYDAKEAMKHLRAEMLDMVSTEDKVEITALMKHARLQPVEFIMKHIALKEDAHAKTECSKPWSFTKAAIIFQKLAKHIQNGTEKPYIGMAFGLDAKCSGPQLGAMMAGDQGIAAACGFASVDEMLEDAYHGAIVEVKAAGFVSELLVRSVIKKPFMGIFYGQGWQAFTNVYATNEDGSQKNGTMTPELTAVIHDGCRDIDAMEKRAKRFHSAVSKSFGAAMSFIRQMCKAYGQVDGVQRCDKKTEHFMPCGFKVSMNYKHKVDIFGDIIGWDSMPVDVSVVNNTSAYKFINMSLNTKTLDCGDFARNGFVNMIQATDALIARLIVVNLKRLGAQHIISVHDCFRVNVKEMAMLEKAIEMAYMQLFGTRTNVKTQDMPMGLDILGMYFDGANAALKESDTGKQVRPSQFMGDMQVRRLQKIRGRKVADIIQDANSYYFAK